MLRIDLSQAPEVWHEVRVALGEEPAAVRVRYRILTKAELDALTGERLRLAKSVRGGDESAALDAVLERLTPEAREAMRAAVLRALTAWDLADPEGNPLPVTPESVGAVLDYGPFLLPFYEGLLEASSGAARKNA
jgi:hypothetical protein